MLNRITRPLLSVLGIACLSSLLLSLTSRPVPAQFAPPVVPVKVTNTPLPITGNVNVTNSQLPVSGNVTANVSGSVNVGNFPAVQSVNFSGPQPVSFSNTTDTPLFTRDVDNPARQPVFGACDTIDQLPVNGFVSCNITFTSPTSSFSAVPAGQRLVIEFVSGEADVPTGTKPLEFGIQTSLGNGYTDVGFATTSVGASQNINGVNLDEYKVSQQTRIYEGTGATVRAEVFASDTTYSNPYTIYVTVTGYLVNVP